MSESCLGALKEPTQYQAVGFNVHVHSKCTLIGTFAYPCYEYQAVVAHIRRLRSTTCILLVGWFSSPYSLSLKWKRHFMFHNVVRRLTGYIRDNDVWFDWYPSSIPGPMLARQMQQTTVDRCLDSTEFYWSRKNPVTCLKGKYCMQWNSKKSKMFYGFPSIEQFVEMLNLILSNNDALVW